MLHRLLFVCMVACLPLLSIGQVRIEGEVTHGDDPLSNVTIQVYEDGKILRTLQANRRGKYETDVPFDKEYILVFRCPFMLPVSIAVNTQGVAGKEREVRYEVPLNMQMFHRFDGMNLDPTESPIGVIQRTGEGAATFSFIADRAVISRLKPLQEESLRRQRSGEEPIDRAREDKVTPTIPETPPKDQEQQLGPRTSALEEEDEPAMNEEPEEIARSLEEERYATVQEARAVEQENARADVERRNNKAEEIDGNIETQIAAQKQVRESSIEQQQEQTAKIADARSMKQAAMLAENPPAPALRADHAPSNDYTLVKHSRDEGMWLSEERIIVERSGVRSAYLKSVYDWLLFEYASFSRDGIEISEEEYEEIKKKMGI